MVEPTNQNCDALSLATVMQCPFAGESISDMHECLLELFSSPSLAYVKLDPHEKPAIEQVVELLRLDDVTTICGNASCYGSNNSGLVRAG